MIANKQELETTRSRIHYLEDLLGDMRVSALPSEFPLVAGGYRADIERMQDEVLDYLTRHSSESAPAEAA